MRCVEIYSSNSLHFFQNKTIMIVLKISSKELMTFLSTKKTLLNLELLIILNGFHFCVIK